MISGIIFMEKTLAPAIGCDSKSARSKARCFSSALSRSYLLAPKSIFYATNGILNLARSLVFGFELCITRDLTCRLLDGPLCAQSRLYSICVHFDFFCWPVHHNSQTSQRFHREGIRNLRLLQNARVLLPSRHNKNAPFCVLMAQNLLSRVEVAEFDFHVRSKL
jgi:hypothetical protein